MDHYRAAIIGLGNIAWRFDSRKKKPQNPLTHAGTYNRDGRVLLVGGCSKSDEDSAEFKDYYNIPVFNTISDLLEKTKPDIVSICSSSNAHFENLQHCLEENIPMIWLEKPPTSNLKQLNILLEKKQQSKSTVLVNYQRRYCLPYNRLREAFQQKSLGQPVFMNITYSRGLLLNGSHLIDMAFFIAGDDKEASLESVTCTGDLDNPSFTLSFSGGLKAFINGSHLPYHNIDISITCEQGRASVLYGGLDTRWEVRREHELFPGFYRLEESEDDFLGQGGCAKPMVSALDNLINSCESCSEPVSNLYTSKNTQKVLELVYNYLNSFR